MLALEKGGSNGIHYKRPGAAPYLHRSPCGRHRCRRDRRGNGRHGRDGVTCGVHVDCGNVVVTVGIAVRVAVASLHPHGRKLVIFPARRPVPGAPGRSAVQVAVLPCRMPGVFLLVGRPPGCQRGGGSRLVRPVRDHGTGRRGSIASRCLAGSQSGSSPPGAPRQAGEISRRARRPSDGFRSTPGGQPGNGSQWQESGGNRNSWVRDS